MAISVMEKNEVEGYSTDQGRVGDVVVGSSHSL